MASIKISELNELTSVEESDLLPIVDTSSNETKKISYENLLNIKKITGNKLNVGGDDNYIKFNYPTDFNTSNCVVIGGKVREKYTIGGNYGFWHSINFTSVTSNGELVANDWISFGDDGIYYNYYTYGVGLLAEIQVELYLLKLN